MENLIDEEYVQGEDITCEDVASIASESVRDLIQVLSVEHSPQLLMLAIETLQKIVDIEDALKFQRIQKEVGYGGFPSARPLFF